MSKKNLIKIFKNNPGSSIDFGATFLLLENDEYQDLDLCEELKINEKVLERYLKEIRDESKKVWDNFDKCIEVAKAGSVAYEETILEHPDFGYFMVSGGGMFAETIKLLSSTEYKTISGS